METTLNYINGRTIIGNKGSLFGTVGCDGENANFKFLQFASIKGKVYDGGVHAHFFVFGEAPDINLGEPMRCNFSESDDAVIYALKQTGSIQYLYGITIENLLAWSPPGKPGELVSESGLLQSWKVTHTDIKELVPLVNTDTHKTLRATVDKQLLHLPSFAASKIKSFRDTVKWCSNTFESNTKTVMDASEMEERKRAKEKSDTAGDMSRASSIAGGEQAAKVWAERKSCLLAAAPFYMDSFKDRFLTVKLDATTGQPTAETVKEMYEFIRCPALRHSLAIA
jgi:hypothetical protein